MQSDSVLESLTADCKRIEGDLRHLNRLRKQLQKAQVKANRAGFAYLEKADKVAVILERHGFAITPRY